MIPDICSMYILLAAATTFEIQPAIGFLEGRAPGPRPGDAAGLREHERGVLITGIGSVATTHSLMRQIGRRKPDIIIQAGIAGCFTGLPAGEVVLVCEEAPGDLGVWEGGTFKTIFDLGLCGKDANPFTDGLLVNPYQRLMDLSGLPAVRGITVNEITTATERIAWHQQNTAPVVESMEGSALHYTCLEEEVAFIQIRSVSNDIGERDKTKWNIPAAIRNLNERLIGLLQELDKHGPELTNKKIFA